MLFWVAIAALVVRFLYFSEHAASAFFNVAILDEKFYESLARALTGSGDATGLNPGFRPWLYPFFLSGCYLLGGEWGYVLALAAQHLLGIVTAVLTADLAIRLFNKPTAGAVAGTLYVLAGPPLYFEGELLITGVFTCLTTTLLWILSRETPSGLASTGQWLAAGLVTGLAAQARPNILLFLAAYPVAAALFHRNSRGKTWALAGSALVGALLTMIAFAWAQKDLVGRFQLVAGAGGVNFYLGNKLGADGMIPRQDRRVTYAEEYRDSVQIFATELYYEELENPSHPEGEDTEAPSPSDISHYWLRRTFEDIRSDPARWINLLGRKMLFLTWNFEIPNNKSYDFISTHESSLLRALPVRWWILLSFGCLGLLHAWRLGNRDALFWITAFLLLHSLGIVLFFVNSRYRIPMWPALSVLAAGGVLFLAKSLLRRSSPSVTFALLTTCGVATISLVNWLQVEPPSYARDFFFRSLANMEKGHLEEAHSDAFRSVQLDPLAAASRFHLGNVILAQGNDKLAYRHYQVAASLSPPEPRILNNLGIILEGRGRPDLAYRNYLHALDLAEDYAPALINAALLELRADLLDMAKAKIAQVEATGFESVLLDCARGFLARQQGLDGEATRIFAKARLTDPETVDRLIEEHRLRLLPGILAPTP